jgi:hypothetical protein
MLNENVPIETIKGVVWIVVVVQPLTWKGARKKKKVVEIVTKVGGNIRKNSVKKLRKYC